MFQGITPVHVSAQWIKQAFMSESPQPEIISETMTTACRHPSFRKETFLSVR